MIKVEVQNMKMLKLMQENKKLREDNEKLKQQIAIMHDIIATEDECINKLVSSTIEEAKRLANTHVFW